MLSPDWGDVPSWGLLVGAALTVIFAGRAFNAQSKQLKDQQEINKNLAKVLPLQAAELSESLNERIQEKEEQPRRQASKIAVWFEVRKITISKSSWGFEWGAHIRNASDLPILDVTTAFHLVEELGNGKPWVPVYVADLRQPIRVIPPASERFIPLHDSLRSKEVVGSDDYVVGIGFTDAAGNRWQRDPRGRLISGTSYGVRWMESSTNDDLQGSIPV